MYKSELKEVSEKMKELREFLRETIDEHKKTFNENEQRDYVDAFLDVGDLSGYDLMSDDF